ncbi:hypothetical protein F9C07_6572 [Aspergillus flavus]|uniref:Uncharacterized protein n=1 Tax=Aspergillus flavus (strain ATCC 200026 / FGSC A1120 / IAM 13836 / NRRL 3357 / JCM 12722 / SRRC 167) TaxID=332952 RepID=A0A7U2MHG7_ASPFN|nr:hypothetical protein F9C07_6572 [Aspergillus flavus]
MIIKEAYLQEKDHSKASTSYTPFAQVNSSNIQPVIRWIKAASQDPNSNGNVETDTLKRIRLGCSAAAWLRNHITHFGEQRSPRSAVVKKVEKAQMQRAQCVRECAQELDEIVLVE